MTKVLHLVAGRLDGGAARGAYWLHKALNNKGVESMILTNARDDLGDSSVISINQNLLSRINLAVRREIGLLPVRAYRHRQPTAFNTSFAGIDFTRHRAYAAADILHLHWVNGLVSTRSLTHVKKPIVWTLRDMWPFTGGCHHALDCERFTERCGRCPQLGSTNENDLSRRLLAQKAASVPGNLSIVGISRWISDQARKSRVFGQCRISTVSNNIDTDLFFPVEKALARRELGFEDGLRTVLIGAQDIGSVYKGFDLFVAAIDELRGEPFRLCTFGKPAADMPVHSSIEVTQLGPLADASALRLAYSASDVFVAPSRAESFGKTLAEAMGCGTPVVCFDATGPRDIVEHRKNGYKAKPFDPKDLAQGIRWVLSLDAAEHEALCVRAREHAVARFDSRVAADQYLDIYRSLLGQSGTSAQKATTS